MRLDINFRIDFHKFQSDTLVQILNTEFQEIELVKFGSQENNLTELKENNDNEILNYWDKQGSIIIKGKNKFYLSLSTNIYGQVHGYGACDYSLTTIHSALVDLIQLLKAFNKNEALIFANIYSEQIHESKHRVVTNLESGGRISTSKGLSIKDFFKFLPGIGWFTFFGHEYVKSIGQDKLLDLDEVNYIKTKDQSIAFSFNRIINEVTLMDLEKIENQIGELYFFGKTKNDASLKHPSGFNDYLKSLENKFKENL